MRREERDLGLRWPTITRFSGSTVEVSNPFSRLDAVKHYVEGRMCPPYEKPLIARDENSGAVPRRAPPLVVDDVISAVPGAGHGVAARPHQSQMAGMTSHGMVLAQCTTECARR